MRRYDLGGWILVAAIAALGCSSSTNAGLGGSKDGGLGGSICTANTDCSSGLCLGGSCANGKPGGGTCTTSADCASGVCQGGACVGNGQGVPSGGGCQSNDQCASGTCTAGKCVAGSGLPDGKSCGATSECASGACTNGVCGTGTGIGGGTGGAGTGTGGAGTGTGGAGTSSGGSGPGAGGTGTSGATGVGGAKTGTGGAAAGGCIPGGTQCTDCIDNDGDGKIDSADPECTGPLDNDEATFATGIPGDNVDPCKQDCFFDGNSGQGDDGCDWELKCDPANPGGTRCPYDPSVKNCPTTQSQHCIDFCTKLVPNGCDCFGCCAIPLPAGGTKNILIQNSCTLADINDPTKCPVCTQSTDCTNTCQHCELCVGKDTLPADCTPPPGTGGAGGAGGATNTGGTNVGGTNVGGANVGGAGGTPNTGGAGGTPCPTPLCPATQQPCGLSCLPACPAATYCLTGCCVPSIR